MSVRWSARPLVRPSVGPSVRWSFRQLVSQYVCIVSLFRVVDPILPLPGMFLVADTQLYKRLCPSVRWSVRPLVRPSVGPLVRLSVGPKRFREKVRKSANLVKKKVEKRVYKVSKGV